MSTDSQPLAPRRSKSAVDGTQARTRKRSDADVIGRLRAELEVQDREVRELRERLRAIHASDAWAMLRTLGQLRRALAPHGTRRDRLLCRSVRGLRRLKKLAVRLSTPRELVRGLFGSVWSRRYAEGAATTRDDAVICLPTIEWHFRFQRPQHLMRQFARAGHPVLYAANRFHGGTAARMRPIETNLLELMLPGDTAANINQHTLHDGDCARMLAALERLVAERGLSDAVIIAQHPYWTPLAESLRERFGWSIVYDCMDDHSGFLDNGPEVIRTERRLIATADLVVASSRRLYEGIRARSRSTVLIRNACEYEHFDRGDARAPSRARQPTIGYYGCIAEWFDGALVADLARLRPGWRFELIGSTLGGDVGPLEDLANVHLPGECPYAELPDRIAGWDVFIIPFRRLPLTEATNPVKVYEMLATGRPVVAVGLPELVPIARRGLIRLAATAEQFAAAIDAALREDDPATVAARRAFARRNTWSARHRAMAVAIEAIRSPARNGQLPEERPAGATRRGGQGDDHALGKGRCDRRGG
jgi:glycosyltransferase involved in cell wall biosynthesis